MKVWEKVVTGVVSVGVLAGASALGVGMVTAMNANTTEPAVVRTVGFGTAGSFDRGAAIETAVADKTAREAEAARVLAEQAAVAAEAARVAAEQQAAIEAEQPESSPEDEPAPDEPSGGVPAVWVDLGNGTGMWDFSHCPTQSGSTGADGNVYCN